MRSSHFLDVHPVQTHMLCCFGLCLPIAIKQFYRGLPSMRREGSNGGSWPHRISAAGGPEAATQSADYDRSGNEVRQRSRVTPTPENRAHRKFSTSIRSSTEESNRA